MAKPLRPKRGTTAKNDAFVGLASEITVDTEKHSIRVHDGVTAGGHEILPKGKNDLLYEKVGRDHSADIITASSSTTGRSLANRFAEIVNVKDFGAVGDGIADDAIAIQNAFNVAGGKCVFFPTGLYRISKGITASNISEIRGYGATLQLGSSAHIRCALLVETTVDLVVSGLSLDVARKANEGLVIRNQIDSSVKPNVTVRDVNVSNVYRKIDFNGGVGIEVQGSLNRVVLNGCSITDVHMATGAGVEQSQGISGIVVSRYGSNNEEFAPYFTVVENCAISNIWSEDPSYYMDQDGIKIFLPLLYPDARSATHAVISNCSIANVRSRSVKLQANRVNVSGVFVTKDSTANAGHSGVNPLSIGEIESQGGAGLFSNIDLRYTDYTMPHGLRVNNVDEKFSSGSSISNVRLLINGENTLTSIFQVYSSGEFEGTHRELNISNVTTHCNTLPNYLLWHQRVDDNYETSYVLNISNCIVGVQNNVIRITSCKDKVDIHLTDVTITNKTVYLLSGDVANANVFSVSDCQNMNVSRSISNGALLRSLRNGSREILKVPDDGNNGQVAIARGSNFVGFKGDFKSDETKNEAQLLIDQSYFRFAKTYIAGGTNKQYSLGTASLLFDNIYAATGTINTSDERSKVSVCNPEDALMRAWGKVNFKVFQFKDAYEAKGESARLHIGVIAQQVIDAFSSEGLDATRYGLLCYDKWDDQFEDVEVVDQEEVLDNNGEVITPFKSHIEQKLAIEAGDSYGIRYEEALALECAYQRWRLDKLEQKLA